MLCLNAPEGEDAAEFVPHGFTARGRTGLKVAPRPLRLRVMTRAIALQKLRLLMMHNAGLGRHELILPVVEEAICGWLRLVKPITVSIHIQAVVIGAAFPQLLDRAFIHAVLLGAALLRRPGIGAAGCLLVTLMSFVLLGPILLLHCLLEVTVVLARILIELLGVEALMTPLT